MVTDFNSNELHIGDTVIVAEGKDFKIGKIIDGINELTINPDFIGVKLPKKTIQRHPKQLIRF